MITFRSGSSPSQIDFFLTRKIDRGCCIDCKVAPGESVVTQHKLLVLDVQIRRRFRKIKRKLILRLSSGSLKKITKESL